MPLAIEGHAIVTADGMIAAADGSMPTWLRNDADWRRFQAALDGASLVVLGRKGHERHPNPRRRRLVLTRSVATLTADPADPNAWFWNPQAEPLESVLAALGISTGAIAVTGGRGVFDYFAPRLTAFDLAEMQTQVLPDGIPCFSAGHPRVVLAGAGLRPQGFQILDAADGVTLTRWVK